MVRRFLVGILALALFLGVAHAAFARGPHFIWASLSKDQIEKLSQLREKFRADTESLRREIFQKRLELRKMYADPKVSEGEILSKHRELNTLMEKLRDKRLELWMEQRKVLTPEQLSRLNEAKMCRCGMGRRLGL